GKPVPTFPGYALAHFGEAPAVDRLPALAGQVEQTAGGIVGDAVEHEVAAVDVDLRLLVGGHPIPQPTQTGDAVDASAGRVDAHDVPGLEDVAVELAVHELELVQSIDVARAGRSDLHGLAHREGLGIDVVERRPAVAEDQAGAVVGQAPALARIAHAALA